MPTYVYAIVYTIYLYMKHVYTQSYLIMAEQTLITSLVAKLPK